MQILFYFAKTFYLTLLFFAILTNTLSVSLSLPYALSLSLSPLRALSLCLTPSLALSITRTLFLAQDNVKFFFILAWPTFYFSFELCNRKLLQRKMQNKQ